MRTIGLLGGMSWESTVGYYQAINQGVKQALGGLHSAKLVMVSVDFAEIASLQRAGDWDEMTKILSAAAERLVAGGAECVLICTNTMHKVAPAIQVAVNVPLLHIADATAQVLIEDGVKKVGLLGTAFTMEQAFYTQRLRDDYQLDVIIPNATDRQMIHDIIFQELCLGEVKPASAAQYHQVINSLVEQGAEAVILGCTEIGMLIKQQDTHIPLYDTTLIHAQQAVAWSLNTL